MGLRLITLSKIYVDACFSSQIVALDQTRHLRPVSGSVRKNLFLFFYFTGSTRHWPAWDSYCNLSRKSDTCGWWYRLLYFSSTDRGSTESTAIPIVGFRFYEKYSGFNRWNFACWLGKHPIEFYSCISTRILTSEKPDIFDSWHRADARTIRIMYSSYARPRCCSIY